MWYVQVSKQIVFIRSTGVQSETGRDSLAVSRTSILVTFVTKIIA